jgi:hypothetical protein
MAFTKQREWAAYQRELPGLLAAGHEGKYVLIRGDDLEGVFDTQEDALNAGYDKFGLTPFFVHQIWAVEPVYRV